MPASGERDCGVRRSFPNSLPFQGSRVRWGNGGFGLGCLWPLVASGRAEPGLAGRGAGARPRALRAAPGLHIQIIDFSLSQRYRLPLGHAGAGPAGPGWEPHRGRPGAAAAALAGAELSPLPLFGTFLQTFLSWLLGSAGGGESWGRGRFGWAKVRNNKTLTNKQMPETFTLYHCSFLNPVS